MRMPNWRQTEGKTGPVPALTRLTVPALTLLVVVLVGMTYSLYRQTVTLKAQLADVRQNPGKYARAETERLLQRVGSLTRLPPGEVPTVATVNSPDRLKSQRFFANAKVGDKVLIFTNARLAILYDPVNHKIVESAPVSFEAPARAEGR